MTTITDILNEQPLVWPSVFPERLSPSSIELYGRCPERWRRKYLLGEREPWGGTAIIGMAVHSAAELNFAQKVESHQDLPVNDVREIAAASFEAKIVEVEPDGIDWREVTVNDSKNMTVDLAAAYHQFGAPQVQPVAVEEWVNVELPAMPNIVGRVDVRAESGIVDVKTTNGKKTEPRPDWRVKGLLYSLMTGLDMEWNVVTRTKTPGVYMPSEHPGLVLKASDTNRKLAVSMATRMAQSAVEQYAKHGADSPWETLAPGTEFYNSMVCSYCSWKDNGCAWWTP